MPLLASLTEAPAVIHAVHCLHRDIAPDNILMLADSGRPLLLDFGAERQEIGDATQALTPIPKRGCAPVEQYAEVPSLMQGPWTDVPVRCAVIDGAVMGAKPPVSVGRTVWPPMPPPAARWRPRRLVQTKKSRPKAAFSIGVSRITCWRPSRQRQRQPKRQRRQPKWQRRRRPKRRNQSPPKRQRSPPERQRQQARPPEQRLLPSCRKRSRRRRRSGKPTGATCSFVSSVKSVDQHYR